MIMPKERSPSVSWAKSALQGCLELTLLEERFPSMSCLKERFPSMSCLKERFPSMSCLKERSPSMSWVCIGQRALSKHSVCVSCLKSALQSCNERVML
jgi:hypothetical protein